jgi:hypothetical protein
MPSIPLPASATLWEGRTRAAPIDSAAYFLACCRYIELNPRDVGRSLALRRPDGREELVDLAAERRRLLRQLARCAQHVARRDAGLRGGLRDAADVR